MRIGARGRDTLRFKLAPLLGLALLAVTGCSTSASLPDTGISNPSPQRFPYCRNHTCETVKELKFDDQEWASITALLSGPTANAAEERERIAITVAAYEEKAAKRAGTTNDRGGTIVGFFRRGQLDCIDEASNTDTLLVMLDNEGLLRWHRRGPPRMRLVILSDGVPHVTATIIERENNATYAVDSWFRDNGRPADVVPLEEWLNGWNPPEPEESG